MKEILRVKDIAILLGLFGMGLVLILGTPELSALVLGAVLLTAAVFKIEYGILFLAAWTPFEPFILKFIPDHLYLAFRYGPEVFLLFLIAILIVKKCLRALGMDSRSPIKVEDKFRGNDSKGSENDKERVGNDSKGSENDKKFEWIKTPIDWPLAIFLSVAILSAIVNWVAPTITILGLRQILRYVLLFYLVVYTLSLHNSPQPPLTLRGGKKIPPAPLYQRGRQFAKQLVWVMLAIVLVQVMIGAVQAKIGAPADDFLRPNFREGITELEIPMGVEQFWAPGQRVFATLGRYDRLGTFLSFFMLLLVGFYYQYKKPKVKWLIALLFLASIPTLILSYSRMTWLGLLLGIGVIGILVKRDRRLLIGLAAVLILAAGFFGFYLTAKGLKLHQLLDQPKMGVAERFLEMFSQRGWQGNYEGLGRLYFIVHTPQTVVKNYPLLGVGPGRYGGGAAQSLHLTEVYDELGLPFGIQNKEGQIDNNWFSIWGETGTLGFLVFIWFIASLFIFSFRVYKKSSDRFIQGLALGYLGSLVVLSFQAFLGPYFEIRTSSMYLWLFGGLIVALGPRDLIEMGKYKLRDAVVAITYQCNSRCRMCNIWQNQKKPKLAVADFRKLPASIRDINLSGGEPFLREDLPEIVRVIKKTCPRAKIIISSNGFATDLIREQMKKILAIEPRVGVAISLDGIGLVHQRVRGIAHAYQKAMATIKMLKEELGMINLRLAFTAGDYNIKEMAKVYNLARKLGIEFTLAALHNAENYFQIKSNVITRLYEFKKQFNYVIREELKTNNPKRWLRAYFTYGLYYFVSHQRRLLPSYAGRISVFIDPLGDVYPCDVSSLKMGNIKNPPRSPFAKGGRKGGLEKIRESETALKILQEGSECDRSWMICTARAAIKRHPLRAMSWVLKEMWKMTGDLGM